MLGLDLTETTTLFASGKMRENVVYWKEIKVEKDGERRKKEI